MQSNFTYRPGFRKLGGFLSCLFCKGSSILLCFLVSNNLWRRFLLLQWCWVASPGLIDMSWNGLTPGSPHLPPTDSSAFLLSFSASPGLANTFASAFCFTLCFLYELSAEPLERLPLYSMRRATASFGVSVWKSAEALHPWPGCSSVEVTPAEKGMVMILGGSLLRSKVWPVFQEELEKSMPLALLLLFICCF